MSTAHDMTVVAEISDTPAEGMNVVSSTLVADIRSMGLRVRVVSPRRVLQQLPELILRPSGLTVFTHGPGPRTVLVTWFLRRLTQTHLVWIATRPYLKALPPLLTGHSSAHHIICNRPNHALTKAAKDAQVIVQPIGMNPSRVSSDPETTEAESLLWPELQERGVPILAHVGHLRASRGLDRLVEIKSILGSAVEVVVQASPYFEPEPGVEEALIAAGVAVRRCFVADIGRVYRSCTLYLFPVPEDGEGAIDLPLSVLEALASRTPVISTPFGALPLALTGTKGLTFAPSPDFAQHVTDQLSQGPIERPDGLPPHLHAARLSETILRILRGES